MAIGDAAYDVCWPPLIFRVLDPSDEWHSSSTETFLGYYREMTGRELQNFDFYLVLKAVFLLIPHPGDENSWYRGAWNEGGG